ncbi:MAG: hypothetical protein LBT97_13305 [Planctomycetota bacterium]|nr:hypothetical protein [Planctomycetota bacterium]
MRSRIDIRFRLAAHIVALVVFITGYLAIGPSHRGDREGTPNRISGSRDSALVKARPDADGASAIPDDSSTRPAPDSGKTALEQSSGEHVGTPVAAPSPEAPVLPPDVAGETTAQPLEAAVAPPNGTTIDQQQERTSSQAPDIAAGSPEPASPEPATGDQPAEQLATDLAPDPELDLGDGASTPLPSPNGEDPIKGGALGGIDSGESEPSASTTEPSEQPSQTPIPIDIPQDTPEIESDGDAAVETGDGDQGASSIPSGDAAPPLPPEPPSDTVNDGIDPGDEPAVQQPDESGAIVVANGETRGGEADMIPIPEPAYEILDDGVFWFSDEKGANDYLAKLPADARVLFLMPQTGYDALQAGDHAVYMLSAAPADLGYEAAAEFLHLAGRQTDGSLAVVKMPGSDGAAFYKGAYLMIAKDAGVDAALLEIAPDLEGSPMRNDVIRALARLDATSLKREFF